MTIQRNFAAGHGTIMNLEKHVKDQQATINNHHAIRHAEIAAKELIVPKARELVMADFKESKEYKVQTAYFEAGYEIRVFTVWFSLV